MIWFFLMIFVAAVCFAGCFYLVSRVRKFDVRGTWFDTKKKAVLCGTAVLVLLFLILTLIFDFINAVICVLHLVLIWLLCDGIAFLLRHITKIKPKCYLAGILAVFFTIAWMTYGYIAAHHVIRTAYVIETEKSAVSEPFRIVGFSDSHVGTTFHGDALFDYCETINKENPDVVVIVGDFVDDGTGYDDMITACKALSTLRAKYGVYFVSGNHDAGYYAGGRGYNMERLIKEITDNGVIFLEDETAPLPGGVTIIGRQDKGTPGRADMKTLTENIPADIFTVVLDHQPADYAAQAEAGVSLVLSGHTHGGQFIPIIHAGEWIGANDRTYGHETRNRTDSIVSSGIADWA
ncbi:MAG: metallophosphoesterase, partial [Clostridia bacterium]|nr:metallophosphoesterase [Clostridia bacterium]